MAIEDPEESTLWPVVTLFTGRLHDVQDYRHSIFIIVSDHSLIGVGRIPRDDSVFPDRAFGWLIIW